MFFRHLCSYILPLLKYWSTPIVTISCFSCSDFNSTLITTHFRSNYSISIIEEIALVSAIYLLHCVVWDFSHMFENTDAILQMEGFSIMLLGSKESVGIDGDLL